MKELSISKQQQGFTLVELIIVIVLLGILAAVAVPNFSNFSSEARSGSVKYVAGQISNANAINKVTKRAFPAKGQAIATSSNCSAAAILLLDDGLPTGYTAPATAFSGASIGTAETCTLTGPDGDTADFKITPTE